jgi:hypothetical protein
LPEAAPDVEQPVAGLDAQLLADTVELLPLQVGKGIVGRIRVAAGIGHALVEAGIEQILAHVVMGLDVAVPPAKQVLQVDGGDLGHARRVAANVFLHAGADQRHEEMLERAVHHLDLLIHVAFGEAEIALGEDAVHRRD